ncbi:MAG: thioredoxin domain-containing protein [Candidatus Gastranaerophilaceae bacterium]
MKNHKLTAILISILVLIILAICIFIFAKREDLFPILTNYNQHNFITTLADEDKLDEKKPTIVLFHSKTCSGCREFMPVFNLIKKKYAKDYNFALLDVDDMNNIPLMRGNVSGIPCLYIFDPYIGNKIHLSLINIGTIGNLEYEIDRYKRIRSYLDLEKAHTEHLKIMEEYGKKVLAAQQKQSKEK